MKHNDTVTRVLEVNPYDIEAMEGWLEEQAAQGLFLKDCLRDRFLFRRDTPRCMRYRMEPVRFSGPDPGPTAELLELYQSAGWRYVDTYGYDFHIFAASDPDAVEPHTDADILAWALKRLSRQIWLRAALALLFYGGMLALEIFLTVFQGFYSLWMYIPLNLLYLISVIPTFWDLRDLRRLYRQLADGVPLAQRRTRKGGRLTSARLRRAFQILFLLLCLVLISLVFLLDRGSL